MGDGGWGMFAFVSSADLVVHGEKESRLEM